MYVTSLLKHAGICVRNLTTEARKDLCMDNLTTAAAQCRDLYAANPLTGRKGLDIRQTRRAQQQG